ncbi:MurR/RpiR family transcriptional regulator [Agrococcus baldri]|uniref:Transcriptional regulator n=1 Tax=Agrococcus baldri TaxID=153730 RepID=A0AA87RC12_9MICO|nr:MurR/RpiR family transcriptional regulator [Agrococcus baldri]GEK80284.1 transcriptional regulator [Agrococcus baldri]
MTRLDSSVSIMARLRAAAGALGPSERRVADVVLAAPGAVVEWSTSELAEAAGTAPATVIRACQSLGFRGFQHLRLELARALPVGDPEESATLQPFADAIDALRHSADAVDAAAIEAAVEAMVRADRVVLVGNGFSGPPLQDAALRLSTLGRRVEAPIDVLGQQFACQSVRPGDVTLALSYSGANAHTLAACRAAHAAGATLVAVTTFAQSPIARLADIVVVTGQANRAHDVDPFLTRLGHLVALHAIHAGLARRSPLTVPGMRDVVADALADDA